MRDRDEPDTIYEFVEGFAVRRGDFWAGQSIGHLLYLLRYLDVAVEDFDDADIGVRVQRAGAPQALSELDPAAGAAMQRLQFRADAVYAVARRLLDRAAHVAERTLPPSGKTKVLDGHATLAVRLAARCETLGVPVATLLLEQIADLTHVKVIRDRLEHYHVSPFDIRLTDLSVNPAVSSLHAIVRFGDDPQEVEFRSPHELRRSIHGYLRELLDFIETMPPRS